MSSKQVASLAPLPSTLPGGAVVVPQAPQEEHKPSVAADAISLSPRALGEAPAASPKKPAPRPNPASNAALSANNASNGTTPKPAVGFKFRLTGLMSFFSTGLTSWIFDPRMLVSNVRSLFGQVYRLAAGTRHVQTVAVGLRAARKEGQAGAFLNRVMGELRETGKRAAAGAWNKVLGVFGKGRQAAVAVEQVAAPAATEVNHGLIGWARLARAEGASPLAALAQGFKRTVETGGDMPRIVAQSREMGGVWGKAFVITGKAARLAPLLNVPIAVLDLVHARQISQDPTVSRRERISKYGQTYFSATAALLSVAAFLVPGPLELIALKAASFAGFGSLGWSVLSSRVMVNFYARVTNFLHIGPHRELEPAPVTS